MMMQGKKITAVLAAVLIAVCLVTTAKAQQPNADHARGRAYLFYGLIAAIDWGMDELAARINRGGVAASTNSHMS